MIIRSLVNFHEVKVYFFIFLEKFSNFIPNGKFTLFAKIVSNKNRLQQIQKITVFECPKNKREIECGSWRGQIR